MKELIVIIGTVVLGCLLFDLIVGDTHSLRTAGSRWFAESVARCAEAQDGGSR